MRQQAKQQTESKDNKNYIGKILFAVLVLIASAGVFFFFFTANAWKVCWDPVYIIPT